MTIVMRSISRRFVRFKARLDAVGACGNDGIIIILFDMCYWLGSSFHYFDAEYKENDVRCGGEW